MLTKQSILGILRKAVCVSNVCNIGGVHGQSLRSSLLNIFIDVHTGAYEKTK